MKFDPTHPLFRKFAYALGASFLVGSVVLAVVVVVM